MWLVTLLLGVFVVCFLLARWGWWVYVTSTADPLCPLPLPPGGLGLPFIGEMINLVLENSLGHDFFSTRRLRHGNVFKTHIMGRPTVRVVGASHIRAVLQSDVTTADMRVPSTVRHLLGPGALTNSVGHAHRAHRKVVLRAFTTQALTGYATALHRIIDQELSHWVGRHYVYDVTERLSARAAWEVLVGMRDFRQHGVNIVDTFQQFLNGFWTLPIRIPGTAFYKAEAANRRLTSLIVAEYQKRQAPDWETFDYHDTLSLILRSGEDQGHPLSESEVTDVIRELLFAGHSTTSSAATSVVMYLGQNPIVLKKLRQELFDHDLLDEEAEVTYDKVASLTYLGDVINETLRLAPPAGGGFRQAFKTMEIGGYQIPKDWTIIWSAFDTHEVSPLYADDRSSFKPERWETLRNNSDLPYNHIPFGGGARSCVGKEYAKLLLRIFTVHIVRKYDWDLENKDVTMLRYPVRHPQDRLPVIFKTRREDNIAIGDRPCAVSSKTNGTLVNGNVSETGQAAVIRKHINLATM